MTRLGADGPLAELDPSTVPIGPVFAVRIGFDTNDEAVGGVGYGGGDPLGDVSNGEGVHVSVDAAASEEDQVAEEVGLENGTR